MKKLVVIITVLIGIMSCKKDIVPSEPPYIGQWRDEYYGTYTVFDTANDVTYQMEIKQIERYFDGGIFIDSVSFINVANKFDVSRTFQQNTIYSGGIDIGVFGLVLDVNGHKWTLSSGLGKKVINDTLELNYTISNIIWMTVYLSITVLAQI